MSQSDITVSRFLVGLNQLVLPRYPFPKIFNVEPTLPAIPRERMLQSGIASTDLQLVLTRLPETEISKARRFPVTPTLLAIPLEGTL